VAVQTESQRYFRTTASNKRSKNREIQKRNALVWFGEALRRRPVQFLRFSASAGSVEATRATPSYLTEKQRSEAIKAAKLRVRLFFHEGEALHQGNPDVQSHGCIHVPAPYAEAG
jgi:hypothetical protein